VLSAIGVSSELAGAAIRMSLGKLSTPEGIARVAELFPSLVERARATVTSSW
jgi:cysteine sulfinate desulfinase/cysteine desulfurase-like protein